MRETERTQTVEDAFQKLRIFFSFSLENLFEDVGSINTVNNPPNRPLNRPLYKWLSKPMNKPAIKRMLLFKVSIKPKLQKGKLKKVYYLFHRTRALVIQTGLV